ncbi:hypothetical protein OKW47_006575 [Paraburkholderia atlantica]
MLLAVTRHVMFGDMNVRRGCRRTVWLESGAAACQMLMPGKIACKLEPQQGAIPRAGITHVSLGEASPRDSNMGEGRVQMVTTATTAGQRIRVRGSRRKCAG